MGGEGKVVALPMKRQDCKSLRLMPTGILLPFFLTVMAKKINLEQFIKKAKEVHGNKYDYSKTKYINNRTKICIICPKHGEFWQAPGIHLEGHGCKKCAIEYKSNLRKYSAEEFIKKAREVHGDKYDYSKVNYINSQTKVCIICPEHGEFWQKPNNHLQGQRCGGCHGTHKLGTESFIEEAKKIHGNKYDYSKVEYVNSKTNVCIICPEHGEFWQNPYKHLNGSMCQKCTKNHSYTAEEWIEEAKRVHNNKYDYSKVNYINGQTKVCIICPEHGEFWQIPKYHLQGCGCPKCNQSHLEAEIENLLKENSIEYLEYYSPKWLGRQHLDFYLPDYNIAIECQGEQHFEPVSFNSDKSESTKQKNFDKIQERDKRKAKLCEENGLKMLYFTHYEKINELGNIYKNGDKLLNELKCH